MVNNKIAIHIDDASKRARSYSWGEIIKTPTGFLKVFACSAPQLDILNSKAKFTFAFAGSGGGKTCLIPLWLFKRIAERPQGRFLVVSPTVKTFKSSELKRHILDTFSDTVYEGTWREQETTYLLPTGGEIIVRTAEDDPKRLRGGQYDAAVMDECYLLSYDAYEEVRRRVMNNDGMVLGVTTPDANNWIYDVKLEADKGNPDFYVRHWSKLLNPSVSKEAVAREKGLMSKANYARMVEGEFSALEGLIYQCFSDPANELVYPVITDNPKVGFPNGTKPVRFFGGNDWGFGDPSAVLMIAECEDGIMYVVEEIYDNKITPDDLAQQVRAMVDRWAVSVNSIYANITNNQGKFIGFYTDTSRPEHTQMFRKAGIPIRSKKVADIVAGCAMTDAWFRSGKLKVYSTCPNLIRELRGYQWKESKYGLKDVPKPGQDHCCFIAGTLVTTASGDIPIEQVVVGTSVLTRQGFRPVIASMKTADFAETQTLSLSNGQSLTATPNHPIYVDGKGFIPLDAVSNADTFITSEDIWLKLLFGMALPIGVIPMLSSEAIGSITSQMASKASRSIFIGRFGKIITDLFRRASISIIKTTTQATTTLSTWRYYLKACTYRYICQPPKQLQRLSAILRLQGLPLRLGMVPPLAVNGISNMGSIPGRIVSPFQNDAKYAEQDMKPLTVKRQPDFVPSTVSLPLGGNAAMTMNSGNAQYALNRSQSTDIQKPYVVPVHAVRKSENDKRQPVYNLTVDGEHEYFANGILVSNCDSIRYAISSHKYGQPPTPATAPQLNEVDELAKAKHYGLVDDPLQQLKELEASKRKQMLDDAAYGTYDDDDPFGIWTSMN